jgi:hypothetical protein
MEPLVTNWELYTCSMKCGKAERGLNAALARAAKKLVRLLKNVDDEDDERIAKTIGDVYVEDMEPVLRKYRHFGAYDSEPCYNAGQGLINAAKDYFGIPRDQKRYEWGDYL